MKIGIDASRAFLAKRTGIEEYSYQVIKHLRNELCDQEVVLYVRKQWKNKNGKWKICAQEIDFELPKNWRVKGLWAPRLWTQVRLSLEMLFHRPDVLFIPAHTVPFIHPRETIVTIHGLEYEFCPEGYSWWERLYMRFSIRHSVRWASHVIAVSENTQHDLMQLYHVPAEKIGVIYEGIGKMVEDSQSMLEEKQSNNSLSSLFFLFVGRLEKRKNVARIIEAFAIFKKKTRLPHRLVLVGKPGYGYKKIKDQISKSKYQTDIVELGYVSEAEKWVLLKKAEALVFPSLYEGFGLPILEAQMVGTPVVTSTTSSLPEIAGGGAFLVDPTRSKELSRALVSVATDERRRAGIINEATQNVDRFSWVRCARGVAQLLKRSLSL